MKWIDFLAARIGSARKIACRPAGADPGHRTAQWLLAAVVIFGLTACEESVNPLIESDAEYTIFGTLLTESDLQLVRVIPIRTTLFASADDPVTWTTVLTDETDGRSAIGRDTLLTFSLGRVAHVAQFPLRALAGHAYRIDVQAEDGSVMTTARTSVAAAPVVDIQPEDVRPTLIVQLIGRQRVAWTGLRRAPIAIQMWYRFVSLADLSFIDIPLDLEVPFRRTTDSLVFDLDLQAHRAELALAIPFHRVALGGIGMTIQVMNDDFDPPGGVFDPAVLSQPGTFSNVDGGYGYFGAAATFGAEWVISDKSAALLGYTPLGEIGRRLAEPRPMTGSLGPPQGTSNRSPWANSDALR